MTKEKLLKILRKCKKELDIEKAHGDADEALISYLNDPQITRAYNKIDKWYA